MNARPCFALLRCGLLFSALAGVSLVSHASANVEISVNGNIKTLKFPSSTIGGYSSSYDIPYTPKTYGVVSTSNNVPAIKSSVPIPITDNKNVIIDVEAKVLKNPKFAESVIKFGKVLPVVSNVIAAAELVDFLKETFGAKSISVKNNNGQLEADIVTKSFEETDGKTYYIYDPAYSGNSRAAACSHYPKFSNAERTILNPRVSADLVWCEADWYYTKEGIKTLETTARMPIYSYKTPCPTGWETTATGCRLESGSTRTVTEPEIEEAIKSSPNWPASSAPLIRKMLEQPTIEVPVDPASTTTSGPSSVPGPKTTATESVPLVPGTNTPASPGTSTTDPGTKTTTTTSTTNITYQGDKIIYNTQNKTESNITNNTTNITINNNDTKTETTENEPPPKEDPKDPCEIDPERIGCSKYGTPPEPGELPKKDQNITITPVDLGAAGFCPPPIPFSVFGRSYALSYQPACDVATYAKTVVLLIASVIAGYVFVGGLKA